MSTVRITTMSGAGGLSEWTRAHADKPVTWTTTAGPGGTLIITDRADDDVRPLRPRTGTAPSSGTDGAASTVTPLRTAA